MRSYYILGYYTHQQRRGWKIPPHHGEADQRDASAKLEHRPGYWASKVWGKLNGAG